MARTTRVRPNLLVAPVARAFARPRAARLAWGLALALSACGMRMSGTWTDDSGLGQIEFREDGTAYMTTFGGTIACTYEVDGDHVLLKGPNGTQVLTRRGDRLEAGMGMSFVRGSSARR